jgi:hypothetical protein
MWPPKVRLPELVYLDTPAVDSEATNRYCRCFQDSVANGVPDPEIVSFSDETWFTLSGNVNSQKKRYWFFENTRAVHNFRLHSLQLLFRRDSNC